MTTAPEPQWWDDLTPEQNDRLRSLIDSRVRLLGEQYPLAHRRSTEEVSDQNRKWVLNG